MYAESLSVCLVSVELTLSLMRIDRFIARNRVIDLESTDFKGALAELLDVCDLSAIKGVSRTKLLNELLDREKQMTTYLGNGVCLPHCVWMKKLHDCGRASGRFALRWPEEYRQNLAGFSLLAAKVRVLFV